MERKILCNKIESEEKNGNISRTIKTFVPTGILVLLESVKVQSCNATPRFPCLASMHNPTCKQLDGATRE